MKCLLPYIQVHLVLCFKSTCNQATTPDSEEIRLKKQRGWEGTSTHSKCLERELAADCAFTSFFAKALTITV